MDSQFLKDKEMTLCEQLYPFHEEKLLSSQGKSLDAYFSQTFMNKKMLTSIMQGQGDELCLIKYECS